MPVRFLAGARFAVGGIGFTLSHARLLAVAVVPMLVQLVIFGGLVALGVGALDDVVARVGPEEGHWYSFLGALLYGALVVVLVVAGALCTVLVGSVVCDPFYDVLSERTEEILLGRAVGPRFSIGNALVGIARELVVTVLRLTVYFAGAVPLFLLGLTGVGSVVAFPLSLAWTWTFIAIEYLGRSQARHAVEASQRADAIRHNIAVGLGFGAVGFVLTYVPFTAPFLVVGATRLFLALAAHRRVASHLDDADRQALGA